MAFFSFCNSVKPEKNDLNVLVILSKGPWENFIATQQNRELGRLKIDYVLKEDLRLNESRFLPFFILLKPLFRLFSRNRLPVCSPTLTCLRYSASSFYMSMRTDPVLLDEGIGSYNVLNLIGDEFKNKFGSGFRFFIAFALFKFVYRRFSLFGGRKYHLFRREGSSLTKNCEVSEAYKATLGLLADERPELSIGAGSVVLLSQPVIEMGLCSEGEYKEIIGKIVNVAKAKGLRIVVKPHPAESGDMYRRLGLIVLSYPGAVEELFARYPDEIIEVWGFSSTALITASAIFQIPSKKIVSAIDRVLVIPKNSGAAALFQEYTTTLDLDREYLKLSRES